MLSSEGTLLRLESTQQSSKLLGLAECPEPRRGARSALWQPEQLLCREQVGCTSPGCPAPASSALTFSPLPCSDQGTLLAQNGRRGSHPTLRHCDGAAILKNICCLHTVNTRSEGPESMSPFPAYIQSSLGEAMKTSTQQSSSVRQEGVAMVLPHRDAGHMLGKKPGSFLATNSRSWAP